jgi:hypothetical protein
MTTFRIIGDVHGKYERYIEIAKAAKYSLQLGDLGFDYSCLDELDPDCHKVLAGNHDNYDKWGTSKFIHMQSRHWLGDFGVFDMPGFGNIFFVRGGFSIDWKYRKEGRTWFKDEELTYAKGQEALELYKQIKPDYMFSHECPGSLIDKAFGQKIWDGELLRPSMTANLLDSMWEAHKPKHWMFGHHHKAWNKKIKRTMFRCLPELGFVDFALDGEDKHIVYAESPPRDII